MEQIKIKSSAMLRDFAKLNTFLTVVETRSFSRASKKLGISQPAVTQQIKLLEDYLKKRIIDRKKSGIILTPEGEEFKKIVIKLRKYIENAEREVMRIIDNKLPLRIGACMTIGEYILPGMLSAMKENFSNDINITIEKCRSLEEKLRDRRLDVILISQPSFLGSITYKEWIDDEIVVCSNEKLPDFVTAKELNNYSWIYREEDSHTRKIVQEILEAKGLDCNNLFEDVQTIFNNVTAVKNAVLRSKGTKKQVVSLISKWVIEEELKSHSLYSAKIKGCNFHRKLYVAYVSSRRDEENVKSLVKYLRKK